MKKSEREELERRKKEKEEIEYCRRVYEYKHNKENAYRCYCCPKNSQEIPEQKRILLPCGEVGCSIDPLRPRPSYTYPKKSSRKILTL